MDMKLNCCNVDGAENSNRGTCTMWLMRARRGTRKRCAVLFVVGICAALMVFSMPFVTAPVSDATVEEIAVPLSFAQAADAPASANVSVSNPNNDAPASSPLPPPPAPPAAPPQNVIPEVIDATDDSTDAPSTSEKAKTVRAPVASSTTLPPLPSPPKTAAPPPAANGSATSSEKTAAVAANATTNSTAPPTAPSTTTAGAAPITAPPPADPVHQRVPLDAEALERLPTVYVITPTFPRVEQIPELTRLGQTLMHVPKLHWIVADDAPKKSPDVEALLRHTGLNYTYILGAMPEAYRKKKGSKPKGVANRMAGLQWIRDHADENGVMYLADDDNSYDIRLFEEMRFTKKVSMWPVGLVTHLGVSTPVVKAGKVVDFYDGWIASRKFPVDMAGFAVNVGFLKSRPNATMPFKAGFEEDGFLRSLNITMTEIEPKAENCTKIYVWHTKTVTNKPAQKLSDSDRKKFNNTNLLAIPNIV